MPGVANQMPMTDAKMSSEGLPKEEVELEIKRCRSQISIASIKIYGSIMKKIGDS